MNVQVVADLEASQPGILGRPIREVERGFCEICLEGGKVMGLKKLLAHPVLIIQAARASEPGGSAVIHYRAAYEDLEEVGQLAEHVAAGIHLVSRTLREGVPGCLLSVALLHGMEATGAEEPQPTALPRPVQEGASKDERLLSFREFSLTHSPRAHRAVYVEPPAAGSTGVVYVCEPASTKLFFSQLRVGSRRSRLSVPLGLET